MKIIFITLFVLSFNTAFAQLGKRSFFKIEGGKRVDKVNQKYDFAFQEIYNSNDSRSDYNSSDITYLAVTYNFNHYCPVKI